MTETLPQEPINDLPDTTNPTAETVDPEDKAKHTKWANEPTLTQLQQDLTDGQPLTDSHALNIDRWLSNLYITGAAKLPKSTTQSTVQPKLIRKQAEWRYPSLSEPFLSSPDLFNVEPQSAGDANRARQNNLVLNYQFNTQVRKVQFIDGYVRDGVNRGTIVVKTGWHVDAIQEVVEVPEIMHVPVEDPQTQMQVAQWYTYLIQLRQADEEAYLDHDRPGLQYALELFMTSGQIFVPQETGNILQEVRTTELANRPTAELKDSRNIIVDPSCEGDYTKAKFIGEKYKTCYADLAKDTNKYFNLDQIQLQSTDPDSDPEYTSPAYLGPNEHTASNPNFPDNARKQFVIHEYWGEWDIHGTGVVVPIVAAWVGGILVRLQENPFPDRRPPYVIVPYLPIKGSVYGEPDGELLEDNQKVVGALTRGAIDLLAKSANSQTGMKKSLLDPVNRRKFLRGDDYEYNDNMDPRQGIHQHVFPEIPNSVFNLKMDQQNEADSLSGVKAFHQGITGDALGSNVGGGRNALDAASKRETGILRRLADGMIQIGQKFLAMNAVFLPEKTVVRVTGDQFVTIRRDDLVGQYDLRLTISTAEEDNQKAQELAFMLQTNGPNDDPEIVRIIRAEIADLRKMPHLAKKIREYQPQPDPVEQQMKMLQLELLQAQIFKEYRLGGKHESEIEANIARAMKDYAQADTNVAKAGEADAKADLLKSQAGQTVAATVQNVDGTDHNRELDKINMKAVMDALTKPEPKPAAKAN
jgi:hypothetical protein